MARRVTRRRWLALSAAGVTALSGCSGGGGATSDGGETDGTGSGGEGDADTGSDDAPPFDPATFRSEVTAWIDDQRRDAGLEALSVDGSRQSVADAVAADMAEVDFYENDSAPSSPRFDVPKRLQEAGVGCSSDGGPARTFLLRTYYDQKIETGEGVEVYSNTSQVARAVTDQMEGGRGMGAILESPDLASHAVGVHVDENGVVYVVYVAC